MNENFEVNYDSPENNLNANAATEKKLASENFDMDRFRSDEEKNESRIIDLRIKLEIMAERGAAAQDTALPDGIVAHSTQQIEGKTIHIYEIEPHLLKPFFGHGFSGGDFVFVRSDLPPRVKHSLAFHEGFHNIDTSDWGGDFGSELRAYWYSAPKDLVGFFQTIWLTISDKDRRALYKKRVGGWLGREST